MSRPLRRQLGCVVARMVSPASPAFAYVQFVALILVVAFAGFGYLGLFGCGGSSPGNDYGAFESQVVARPHISGPTTYRHGERVTLSVYCSQVGDTPADTVTIVWSPPNGATDFQFPEGREPDNIDTGPPFDWANVPWDQARNEFDLSYRAPEQNPQTPAGRCLNGVVVFGPDNANATATHWSHPSFADQSGAARAAKPLEESASAVWQVQRWLDSSDGTPLNAETANGLIAALRQGVAFVAVKVPDGPAPADGESAVLPWLTDDAHPATLEIVAWGSGTTYQGELELAFDRMPFCVSELPTADGDQWLTLVLAPDAPNYTGPSASGFSLKSTIYLDLADRPESGEGTVLESYLCYEGATEPPALLGAPGLRTYQGYGITAYGPLYQTLMDAPAWELVNTSYQEVEPGERILFEHHVTKTGGALDLDMLVTCDLDVDWSLYYGDWEGPNMGQPVSGKLRVDESPEFFWIVSDPVTASAANGLYEVYVTATLGEDAQTVSDIFWVGDWVAPPSGPPVGEVYEIAVPVIMLSKP